MKKQLQKRTWLLLFLLLVLLAGGIWYAVDYALYANIGFSDAVTLQPEEIESMEILTGLNDARYETHDTAYIAQVLEELDTFRFQRGPRIKTIWNMTGGWSFGLEFTVKDNGGRIRYIPESGFSCFDGYDKPCITGGYSVDDLNRMDDLMKEIYYYLAEHGTLTYAPRPPFRNRLSRIRPNEPESTPAPFPAAFFIERGAHLHENRPLSNQWAERTNRNRV